MKNQWLSLAAAAWVGFLPGLSFISSGVTYEPLAILTVTLFFYLISCKVKLIWLILTASVGVFIKPDLIFMFFLLPRVWLALPLVLAGFYFMAPIVDQTVRGANPWLNQWLYLLPLKDFSVYSRDLVNLVFSGRLPELLLNYSRQFISIHYAQIFPWYWGVFGWLEKTMPGIVYSVLKLFTMISFFGITKIWPKAGWLVKAILIQAAVVIINDILVFSQTGELYGIQGRYFYPAISLQMILFTWGLNHWLKSKYLIAGAIGLNLIGLYSLTQYFGWVW